jgi:membrane protein YdbS with pleckstrin-like domain
MHPEKASDGKIHHVSRKASNESERTEAFLELFDLGTAKGSLEEEVVVFFYFAKAVPPRSATRQLPSISEPAAAKHDSQPITAAAIFTAETTIWTGRPSHYHYFWLWVLGLALTIVGVGLLLILLIFILRARYTYLVTNRRAVLTIGLVIKSSKEVRIGNIRHVNILKRGLSGLFGVGHVLLPSAATDHAEVAFRYVRRPEQIRDIIRRIQDETAAASHERA